MSNDLITFATRARCYREMNGESALRWRLSDMSAAAREVFFMFEGNQTAEYVKSHLPAPSDLGQRAGWGAPDESPEVTFTRLVAEVRAALDI